MLKIFYKSLIVFGCLFSNFFANPPYPVMKDDATITFKNAILAKVEDKTITTYDVVQKLDILFNKNFPELVNSASSKYQFYMSSWQNVLDEMINNQLVLLDAKKKELKITEAEIREEMDHKYGPNIMASLEKLNLSYDSALKLTKEEMSVQRMLYYFVRHRAEQKITPSVIRNSYRLYCKQNPLKEEWSYYVISIKSKDSNLKKEFSEKIYSLLLEKKSDPKQLEDDLKELEKAHPDCSLHVSSLYKAQNSTLTLTQQQILKNLKLNSYSNIITQKSRQTKEEINRIFYLKNYEKTETKSFEEMFNPLKEKLFNEALITESSIYFEKLNKLFYTEKVKLAKNFVPFNIEQ